MADKIQGWPDFPIPEGVKYTVIEFYRLLDIYSEAACRQWAELFVPDGEMVIDARESLHVRGREALTAERRSSWAKLAIRNHSTESIYCHNKEGTDLVILGSNDVTMRNGVSFSQECAQRLKLQETENGYQIMLFKSYIDSAPLVKAIAAAPLKPQPPMPENHESAL